MKEIRVVELFAGVGGFRLGLEGWQGKSASSHYTKPFKSPYKVVWSNQWEPSSARSGELQEANMVYHHNWQDTPDSKHYPHDLNSVASPEFTDKKVDGLIPDHDMLVGGFPCQDYSVAGVNTKGIEGRKGVLWWNIHKILKVKRPKFVFLENVDRLLKSPTNNRGRDFAIMLATLNDLGYTVEWKAINAADFGMPQRRRRVYILAFQKSSIIVKDHLQWIETDGIFATAFPSSFHGPIKELQLEKDLKLISDQYNEGKFLNCGVMKDGKVLMSDFKAICPRTALKDYSLKYQLLGDILLNGEMKDEPSYFIDANKKLKEPLLKIMQTGFEVDARLKRQGDVVELHTELDKWIYLKGRKAEERISSKGKFYYKEGPLSLTDDLNKPSRTIITSEGGPGASRFKHLIEIDGKFRRLHPIELERLNMFPDNHTAIGTGNDKEVAIGPAKRAFFMGNALVVGVVEKVGEELKKKDVMKTIDELRNRAESLKDKFISELKPTLDVKDKGAIGKIIEECGFGVKNNSESRPDFHEIGVELKVVPLKQSQRGLSVKERTKVCLINYNQIVESSWETSHAKHKLDHILFVFYHYNKENHLESQIKDYYFFELKNQLEEPIIQSDWHRTKQIVADGRAHELSESQNKILAASRSGAGGLEEHKNPTQPNTIFQKHAPQRSFSLKPSYTNVIWNELKNTSYDTIRSIEKYKTPTGIENFILGRLQFWHGKYYNDLLKHYNFTPSKAKNSTATIIRKALGFEGNKPIKEIEQLGLIVKTIQCRAKDLMPFEAMSFPHQGIGDLIEEERFDQSEFYSYLQGFLMIPIYKIDKQDPNPIIGKAFIYYPEKETILKIQTEWEGFRDRAKNLSITKIPANNKNGFYRESNLPAKTEIIHMRPHGRDAMDLDTTAPIEITKHCFWLNKGFIQELLRRNQ